MEIETKSRLAELLEYALVAEGADMGNIQVYRKEFNDLVIVAQRGFQKEFLEYFKSVKAFDSSACGRAFGIGNPVIINDIELDGSYGPHLSIARQSGFRAVKSVPILNPENEYVGVISTHFQKPKFDWELTVLNNILPEISFLL